MVKRTTDAQNITKPILEVLVVIVTSIALIHARSTAYRRSQVTDDRKSYLRIAHILLQE